MFKPGRHHVAVGAPEAAIASRTVMPSRRDPIPCPGRMVRGSGVAAESEAGNDHTPTARKSRRTLTMPARSHSSIRKRCVGLDSPRCLTGGPPRDGTNRTTACRSGVTSLARAPWSTVAIAPTHCGPGRRGSHSSWAICRAAPGQPPGPHAATSRDPSARRPTPHGV